MPWYDAALGYLLASTLVSIPFLFGWSAWRKRRKLKTDYDEKLISLFLIRQKDTGHNHIVFFGETSGTIAPTLGNTYGRYENLSYMCPEYEFEPEPIIICPASLKIKDLQKSVGEWIDRYWENRFKEKK